jgi:predicted aspartyl protease
VCRNKKEEQEQEKSSANHVSTIYKVNGTIRNDQSRSYSTIVPLQVNNHNLNFDLDTGTNHTIINVKDWRNIGSPIIRPSTTKLQSYNSIRLQVKGQCNVRVNYKGKTFNLIMIVVHGTGLPLLGLQWIKSMEIDVNDIVHGTNYIRPVNKVYSQIKHITSIPPYPVHNSFRSHRQASRPSTGISSSNTLRQHPNRIGFDQLKQNQSTLSSQTINYSIGQLVWFTNSHTIKLSYWQPAIITKKIFGSIVYEIQLKSGHRRKCVIVILQILNCSTYIVHLMMIYRIKCLFRRKILRKNQLIIIPRRVAPLSLVNFMINFPMVSSKRLQNLQPQ